MTIEHGLDFVWRWRLVEHEIPRRADYCRLSELRISIWNGEHHSKPPDECGHALSSISALLFLLSLNSTDYRSMRLSLI